MGRALVAIVFAAAVGLVAFGSPALGAGAPCRPSASLGGGPFETNASPPPRRSRIGRGHVLTGRVLQYPGCSPDPRSPRRVLAGEPERALRPPRPRQRGHRPDGRLQ